MFLKPLISRYWAAVCLRTKVAIMPAGKHLLISGCVAMLFASLVFYLWYPHPFSELCGGRGLFVLVMSVDVACGPLLTFVVFDVKKPRTELYRDIGFVVVLQVAALAYGVTTTLQARPVYLAFEGDRFRVVSLPDIEMDDIARAPLSLQKFGFTGPKLVGVKLLNNTDPEFPLSIQQALNGVHPSFRPARWVEYSEQKAEVLASLKPISLLLKKTTKKEQILNEAIRKSGVSASQLGYLPLVSRQHDDWIVLVQISDTHPVAYLPIDAF